MNRWVRCVPLGIVIGVVMVVPVQLVSLAEEPAKEPVRPAAEIIAAWEKAGAEFGWISVEQWGNLWWRSGKAKPMALPDFHVTVPAFKLTVFAPGKLKTLPP